MYYWILAALALMFFLWKNSGIKLLGASQVRNRTKMTLNVDGKTIDYSGEGNFKYGDEIRYQGKLLGYFQGKDLGQITEQPDPYQGIVIVNKYPFDITFGARTMHGEWSDRFGTVGAGETAHFSIPEIEAALYIMSDVQDDYKIASGNKLVFSIQ